MRPRGRRAGELPRGDEEPPHQGQPEKSLAQSRPHRLVKDGADGAQRQCRTGQHDRPGRSLVGAGVRAEERGRHRRADQGQGGGPGRQAVDAFGGRGRTSGVGRVEAGHDHPAPGGDDRERNHPGPAVAGRAAHTANPSTSRPAPSKKNESVMTAPYEPLAYSLRRSLTGLRSARSTWRSTNPAALDRSRAIATGRRRALRAPPRAARTSSVPGSDRPGPAQTAEADVQRAQQQP